MKRLLLPLLTAIALPAAVSAESYWLVILYDRGMEKIEMESIDKCEIEGQKWKNSKLYKSEVLMKKIKYICLTGK